MDFVTLDTEWWQDAGGNPVAFGSPLGVSVLYGIGSRVPSSVADSLKALEQADDKAILATPADKAIRSPRARK